MKSHKIVQRDNVFRVIEVERNYQDSLISERLPIGEEIALLIKYVHRALDKWTEDMHDVQMDVLIEIRKIAAIATRCMENHGAPVRINYDSIPVETFDESEKHE